LIVEWQPTYPAKWMTSGCPIRRQLSEGNFRG
jgi:hypothetical protein